MRERLNSRTRVKKDGKESVYFSFPSPATRFSASLPLPSLFFHSPQSSTFNVRSSKMRQHCRLRLRQNFAHYWKMKLIYYCDTVRFKNVRILVQFILINKLKLEKLFLSQLRRSLTFTSSYHHGNLADRQQSWRSNSPCHLKRCGTNVVLSVMTRKAINEPQLGPKYTHHSTCSGNYIGFTREHRQTWALYEGPPWVKRRERHCEHC